MAIWVKISYPIMYRGTYESKNSQLEVAKFGERFF